MWYSEARAGKQHGALQTGCNAAGHDKTSVWIVHNISDFFNTKTQLDSLRMYMFPNRQACCQTSYGSGALLVCLHAVITVLQHPKHHDYFVRYLATLGG